MQPLVASALRSSKRRLPWGIATAVRQLSGQSSGAAMTAGSKFRPSDMMHSNDLDAFERVANARGCCRNFDADKQVSRELLSRILAIVQRTPSGFNLQPWHVVIVDSDVSKHRLAESMLGSNPDRVLGAPMSAVFLADPEPFDHGRVERVVAMERDAGKPSNYLRNLPFDASVFIGRSQRSDPVGSIARGVGLGLAQLVMPLPSPTVSPLAWAYKQSAMAAMSYMHAATAAGLGTYPMEGFDAARLLSACAAPAHLSPIMVIATGYEGGSAEQGRPGGSNTTSKSPPSSPQATGAPSVTRSARLSAEYLFKHNTFNTPFMGVQSL